MTTHNSLLRAMHEIKLSDGAMRLKLASGAEVLIAAEHATAIRRAIGRALADLLAYEAPRSRA